MLFVKDVPYKVLLFQIFFNVYRCFVCESVHMPCAFSVYRGQKKPLDPLKIEL